MKHTLLIPTLALSLMLPAYAMDDEKALDTILAQVAQQQTALNARLAAINSRLDTGVTNHIANDIKADDKRVQSIKGDCLSLIRSERNVCRLDLVALQNILNRNWKTEADKKSACTEIKSAYDRLSIFTTDPLNAKLMTLLIQKDPISITDLFFYTKQPATTDNTGAASSSTTEQKE